MSADYFSEHVQPHLRVLRKGSEATFLVRDLEEYALKNVEPSMAEQVGAAT